MPGDLPAVREAGAVKRADVTEAGAILRRLLDAIDRGELDASAGERNRLEGALAALDAMAAPSTTPAPPRG